MLKLIRILIVGTAIVLSLAACGRANIDMPTPTSVLFEPTVTPSPAPNADLQATEIAASVARGDEIFHTNYSEAGFACSNCHSVDSDAVLVGPSMLGISERAADRVDGEDAQTYIHNSIVAPNDYLVEGFNAGLMPQIYGDVLSEQDLEDVIAYLMSLQA